MLLALAASAVLAALPPATQVAPPRHPSLGCLCRGVDRRLAERWEISPEAEAQLVLVLPGGAADGAGLRKGDVLLEVNGRPVTSPGQLAGVLDGLGVKTRVALLVVRDGGRVRVTAVLRPEFSPAEEARGLRVLADREDVDAWFALGTRYLEGNGVAADAAEAARWFRKAADRRHARSAYFLGGLYEEGRGAKVDRAAALKFYRRAGDLARAAWRWHRPTWPPCMSRVGESPATTGRRPGGIARRPATATRRRSSASTSWTTFIDDQGPGDRA
jgi:membrane-associated protease RseP (regulator of RpoE activity)